MQNILITYPNPSLEGIIRLMRILSPGFYQHENFLVQLLVGNYPPHGKSLKPYHRRHLKGTFRP